MASSPAPTKDAMVNAQEPREAFIALGSHLKLKKINPVFAQRTLEPDKEALD
jgi:hypothetical protein